MSYRTHKKSYRVMFIFIVSFMAIVIAVAGYMNHPKFGRLPQGERLQRIKQSPNYHNGTFHNQHPTPQLTSDKGRIRTMFDFLFEKRERNRPEYNIPILKTDLRALQLNEDLLVWFGHSSYFIQSNGKRILIDPVFEDASPISLFNKPFRGTDVYKAEDIPDVDYLIITHDHWDHLDYSTLKKLRGRTGKVICPLGVGEHLEYWGFDKNSIAELDWNEQVTFDGDHTIHCLPARHFSGRTFKPNQTFWASFMIVTSSRHIYISGDGGYDTHFAEISKRFPDIDIAILENGQYNKDWKYIHLMPDDLVKAIKDLNAKKIFTGHNSKYALSRHAWDEPMKLIAATAQKEPLGLVMPIIGEVVPLSSPTEAINKWWEDMPANND